MTNDSREPDNAAPTATHLESVQLFPAARVVQIVYREKFAIRPQAVTVSFETIEATFLSILNMSLMARGIAVGLATTAPTAPTS